MLDEEPKAVEARPPLRLAIVSSMLPRRCGLATFTADFMAAARVVAPAVRCSVAAIDEPHATRSYDARVRWRIRQEDAASYRAAARAINAADVDAVLVQHEFGLYGIWTPSTRPYVDDGYDDHYRLFLDELRKPVLTTLHTVLPNLPVSMRRSLELACDRSIAVVVMADAAASLLRTQFKARRVAVIPHGISVSTTRNARLAKTRLGLTQRTIISTCGFVDPRKGFEHMIDAMPALVTRYPDALYLIVGQTHPSVLEASGEAYRNGLVEQVARLDLHDHVRFVDRFLPRRDLMDYLRATDVYVNPYPVVGQASSGALSYALGAGRAVVSTRYVGAVEVLADDRGVLVDRCDAGQLSAAVLSILDDASLKVRLERRATAYARQNAWTRSARRFLELLSSSPA